jgi:hypothetical protein
MSSITASARVRRFDLAEYAASLDLTISQTVADQTAAQREAKRKAKHDVEMLALEYSRVMLQKSIDDALDPNTDPRLRRDLRNDVLNRGIGRVPEAESDAKKKQDAPADAMGILEFLAGVSAGAAIAETAAQQRLGHTRDVTPPIEGQALDGDFEQLMRDIEDEQP